MSGLVGSIRNESNEFNDIAMNNTIEGIKMANYVYSKTKQAEKDAKEASKNVEKKDKLDANFLVESIQKDMEDAR